MTHSNSSLTSLPHDLSFKILSCLQVRDVCALGSCSKYWRELCGSDPVWVFLSKQRWPSLSLPDHQSLTESSQGWKAFYMNKHYDIAGKTSCIIEFVEQCSSSVSLEARDYLKAVEDLCSIKPDFKDIELLLFKPGLNVLLNLLGLHYCISWLQIPPENVLHALEYSKVSERQVSVKWWKIGQWFYGFRLRDETLCRLVSLADLTASKQEEILGVLRRGAIYEVIRIQISVAFPLSESWMYPAAAPRD